MQPDHAAAEDVPRSQHGASSMVLEVDRRAKLQIRGAITTIRPPTGDSGIDLWSGVVVDGPQPETERTLRILIEEVDALPFAVSDVIDVDVDCTRGGWHHVCDGSVRDASGALLLAALGTGDASRLVGWTTSEGPVIARPPDGKAGHIDRALVVSFEGRSVTTASGWRRLTTPTASWVVTGASHRWTGRRVPEAVDYTTLAIMRVRTR